VASIIDRSSLGKVIFHWPTGCIFFSVDHTPFCGADTLQQINQFNFIDAFLFLNGTLGKI
jgi:hypothetical protein